MCKQFTVAKLETPPNTPRFAGDARQSWGFAGAVIYISSLRGSYFSYVEENTAFKTTKTLCGFGFFLFNGGLLYGTHCPTCLSPTGNAANRRFRPANTCGCRR